jgi:hypothetical protein
VRRGQPDVSQRLVVLRGLVELDFQLLVELQRVQLLQLVELLEFLELVVLLELAGLQPRRAFRAPRPARS